jgi:sortase (surface protein transpeptidase)
VRRWLLVLVACATVAVGVPAAWFATRPSTDAGVPVASVGARVPASTPPASPEPSPDAVDLPTMTARPATAPSDASAAPTRVRIPSVGVDAAIVPVGVDGRGFVVIPREVRQVGWYRFGPAPGDPAGAAVFAGHVDTRQQGAGALFPLRSVDVGDRITVTADGRDLEYRVVGKQTIVKQRLPVEELFARDGAPRLVLITCGGPFVRELGSYRDNLVVVATPMAGSR